MREEIEALEKVAGPEALKLIKFKVSHYSAFSINLASFMIDIVIFTGRPYQPTNCRLMARPIRQQLPLLSWFCR